MAIDRTFESALMKAIRGLEVKQKTLIHEGFQKQSDEELRLAIKHPTDERLWAIAEGLRRGWGIDEINKICRVDKWFLNKLQNLIEQEGSNPEARARVFKMVDTCAGEFESKTPYFYGADEVEDDAPPRSPAKAAAKL